jgi:hypothetical protein
MSRGKARRTLSTAKRHWEVEVVDRDRPPDSIEIPPVTPDGRIVEDIPLEDAPGYVVPRSFDAACQDDPVLPADVTLQVDVTITRGPIVVGVHLTPRREPRPTRWPLAQIPAQEWIGFVNLPLPQLLREALAHAAMPAARPMIDELGWHAQALLETLPARRKPRITVEDRELVLHYYALTLTDNRYSTESERLAAVWQKLFQDNPERWPSLTSVKRVGREAAQALDRAGGPFTLQPGTWKLPSR